MIRTRSAILARPVEPEKIRSRSKRHFSPFAGKGISADSHERLQRSLPTQACHFNAWAGYAMIGASILLYGEIISPWLLKSSSLGAQACWRGRLPLTLAGAGSLVIHSAPTRTVERSHYGEATNFLNRDKLLARHTVCLPTTLLDLRTLYFEGNEKARRKQLERGSEGMKARMGFSKGLGSKKEIFSADSSLPACRLCVES